MFKKVIVISSLFLLIATQSMAFLYVVKILTKEEIQKLNEEELLDVYIEVVIERKATETFHGKAGFTPKEYNKYKDLLSLIVKLRKEMIERKIDAPPIEEWLR